MKQFLSFVRKEFYHIFRDVRTMMILLVMPVILIILFGFAITTEVTSVPFAVFDQSRDDVTEKITEQLNASEYFDLYDTAGSYEEIRLLFRKEKIKIAIIYPPQFASAYEPVIQILVDATDPNQATSLTQYATAIISSSPAIRVEATSLSGNPVILPVTHLLYNPLMKGAYNFVPGVMGLILMLICALMTSVGIVREKETGTMEVLLVSPLKPIYIILAKGTPYLLLSMVNIASILLLSYYVLDVPIEGSVTLLFMLSIIYSIVSLSLGLLISTVADSQQSAMLISGMALMLPVMLLSDMLFPTESMPYILQLLSNIIPAKWYIMAVKDVMIKGLGTAAIMKELIILTVMAIVLIAISLKRFKIRLE